MTGIYLKISEKGATKNKNHSRGIGKKTANFFKKVFEKI